jgi:hypothetical protein
MSAGLVLIAGSITAALTVSRNAHASLLVAALVAIGLVLLVRPHMVLSHLVAG